MRKDGLRIGKKEVDFGRDENDDDCPICSTCCNRNVGEGKQRFALSTIPPTMKGRRTLMRDV